MKLIFLLLFLLLFLTSCAATVPTVQQVSDTEYRIVGKLEKEDYDEIIRIVKSHPNKTISFYASSPGGTSADLFQAMDAVYEHGNVYWYSLNHCDSACAVMALSTKHGYGLVRLHSFYKHHRHHAEASPEFNEKVLNKLSAYGYDKNRLRHMFDSVEKLCPILMYDDNFVEE